MSVLNNWHRFMLEWQQLLIKFWTNNYIYHQTFFFYEWYYRLNGGSAEIVEMWKRSTCSSEKLEKSIFISYMYKSLVADQMWKCGHVDIYEYCWSENMQCFLYYKKEYTQITNQTNILFCDNKVPNGNKFYLRNGMQQVVFFVNFGIIQNFLVSLLLFLAPIILFEYQNWYKKSDSYKWFFICGLFV